MLYALDNGIEILLITKEYFVWSKKYWPNIRTCILILLAIISLQTRADTKVHISIDGLSWQVLSSIDNDTLRFLGAESGDNVSGTPLTPFVTTNTGPAHVSLYSNVTPQRGGWVGNMFLEPNSELHKPNNAFAYPSQQEIYLLPQLLERQNKRTACINVPGLGLSTAEMNCTVHLGFSRPLDKSCHVQINDGVEINSINVEKSNDVSNCFLGNASNLILDSGHLKLKVADVSVALHQNKVTQVTFSSKDKKVSKLVWINSLSNDKKTASVYIGPGFSPAGNEGFFNLPEEHQRWAGTQDSRSYISGKISKEGFLETLKFQADYIFKLTRYLVREAKLDAIFSYTSLLDTIGHNFTVTKFTNDKLNGLGKLPKEIRENYLYIDRQLHSLHSTVNNKNGSFFVTSDHGMAPAYFNLGITSYLDSQGFNVFDKDANIVAYTSGATLHLYAKNNASIKNEQGKELNQTEIIDNIVASLKGLKYGGQTVFDIVLSRRDLESIELAHENSGDVVAITNVGFGLDTRRRPTDRLFYRSTFNELELKALDYKQSEIEHAKSGLLNRNSPGIHGHSNTKPEMRGIFYTNVLTKLSNSPANSSDVSLLLFCHMQEKKECF